MEINRDLFQSGEALTFDGVLVVPAYSEVLPVETDGASRLTAEIQLNIPLLSAAMDTVSEARLAIALAREGGIGILHRNMSPEQQATEVDKVKRSQSEMITDPATLLPEATLQQAEDIMSTYKISGVPIVDGEKIGRHPDQSRRVQKPYPEGFEVGIVVLPSILGLKCGWRLPG